MGMNIGYLTSLFGGSPVVPGTGAASQPLVLDSSRNVTNIAGLTATTVTASTVGVHTGTWRITVNPDVAGTGTNLATAAQLSEGFTVITGANGTLAWKLPATPTAGSIVIVKGTTAGVAVIFPDAAATINAIGSNGAISLASGVVPAMFIAKSATQWYTFPLLPS